jgi:hypothetical protein
MDWRKALLVGVVVLLVLIGLPLLMPGMGAVCEDCGPMVPAGPCVLAVLSGFVFLIVLTSSARRDASCHLRLLLRAVVFDRPPQVA